MGAYALLGLAAWLVIAGAVLGAALFALLVAKTAPSVISQFNQYRRIRKLYWAWRPTQKWLP